MSVDPNVNTSLCLSCKGYHPTTPDFHFPLGGPLLREPEVQYLCKNCGACTHTVGGEWRLYWITGMACCLSLIMLGIAASFLNLFGLVSSMAHVMERIMTIAYCGVAASVLGFVCLIWRDLSQPSAGA